ncbi:MAG: hypothetical protein ABIQ52_01850 [Vicinamibacterales bacterium]
MTAAAAVELSAHRRDEYLQAARIAIDPARVQIELDLTPGIALADAILDAIDRSRDGVLSAAEQQSYAALVLGALALEIDGTPLRLQLGAATFPDVDAVRRGEGTIRLASAAVLQRQAAGLHQLTFRNRHHRERSVYLANALVPESRDIAVTAQRRDSDQTELTIDYVVRGTLRKGASPWLVAGIAIASVLSLLLIRPLRSLR